MWRIHTTSHIIKNKIKSNKKGKKAVRDSVISLELNFLYQSEQNSNDFKTH